MIENSIDLVYLWVDGNDPQWLHKRNSFLDDTVQQKSITGRYENSDELKYSLRSVEKNLPWVRKIFIVTDSQFPDFLDTSNPKITIVDHTDIIPQKYLPLFNSVIIEYFIHNIPDLSEQFLLASDDCFVNRQLTPDFFFRDGLPIVRAIYEPLFNVKLFCKRLIGSSINNYRLSIENAYKLIKTKYRQSYPIISHHNIDAYVKSEYERTVQTFQKELEVASVNRFRSDSDIQRLLFQLDLLARKRGILKYVDRRESCRLRVHKNNYDKYIRKYNPALFCLNDTDHSSDEDRKRIAPFLERLFPHKSEFER